MKFQVVSNALSEAIDICGRIVERRNTYPILGNVLLTAEPDGILWLRSTDLDIQIVLQVAAEVENRGVTTLPARVLGDVLKKMGKGAEVKFEIENGGQSMKVAAGRSRFSIAALGADSFPDLKSGTFSTSFEISGKALSSALGKVSFAISNEETRYYLNGVYMHAIEPIAGAPTYINFVATDGHRLAQCRRLVPDARGMPGIIVPKKAVAELIKMAERAGDGSIAIDVSDTKIQATFGKMVLLSKLIEGTFPDYERVTPKGGNIVAVVDTKAMAAAVDRVSTVASDKGGKSIKLVFTPGNLVLEVSNPDHGTATEDLPADVDAPLDIGFNARYLGELLGILGGREIRIGMIDGGAPALVTPTDTEDEKYVLMPMRV